MKKFLFAVYNILLIIVLPVFFVFMLFLFFIKNKRATGFFYKLFPFLNKGLRKKNLKNALWVHAVSLGELKAASNFLELLRQNVKTPICISTTTRTGYDYAKKNYEKYSDKVYVFYFPYDFYFSVKTMLKLIKPVLFICIETEIWPNLFRLLKKEEVKIAIINARMSDSSFKNYLRFDFFFKYIFEYIDLILCISPSYCEKFLNLGIKKERLHATGNMKFDSNPSMLGGNMGDMPPYPYIPSLSKDLYSIPSKEAYEKYNNLIKLFSGCRIITAGSTHEGEERLILKVFKKLNMELQCEKENADKTGSDMIPQSFSRNCLFLAPRHPERFDSVYGVVNNYELECCRLSEIYKSNYCLTPGFSEENKNKGIVVLVDIIGELTMLYNLCDVAFVGGSMVDAGGHNLLEPLFFGKPVVFGRFTENFSEIAAEIVKVEAGKMVLSEEELYMAIYCYLNDKKAVESAKENGLSVIERNKGASVKNIQYLRSYYKAG